LKEYFNPPVQRCIPERGAILDVLFKDRFHKTCLSQGFAVPPTECPLNKDEALVLAKNLEFPLLLKPRSHVGVGLARGAVARTPAELEKLYAPYSLREEDKAIVDEFPELQWPLLQVQVQGCMQHVTRLSGFITPDGQVMSAV